MQRAGACHAAGVGETGEPQQPIELHACVLKRGLQTGASLDRLSPAVAAWLFWGVCGVPTRSSLP
jgi:hypothetical protein